MTTTILLALHLLSGAPSASLDALYDAAQDRADLECAAMSEEGDIGAPLPLDCMVDMLATSMECPEYIGLADGDPDYIPAECGGHR